ncbi:hypothetical protein ZOSMA_106G00450 [Zostera marina]|uniref:DUF7963 domain-containing protein n=1 Tax=Zostera marina TaxID=29655 RepID=A0A0K9Q4Q3_ZOSMR|nr:hypothetical protein ZOSMA_106G00450 [Zostera marina]
METASATVSSGAIVAVSAEDEKLKAVQKRYDGLTTVRTKAIKGKGAWYWRHLEPVLIRNTDTGLPKAVKLQCALCHAAFSASNPSRTASEHLKRGTCPNFNSINLSSPASVSASAAIDTTAEATTTTIRVSTTTSFVKPISSLPPSAANRKRTSSSSYQVSPLTVVDPTRFLTSDVGYSSSQQHLVLSGGKEDLGALAMLEDSVKRLKSPKASPGNALSKAQVESAVSLLTDWIYESAGAVSFSSIEHPKFKAFLHQVGLPPIPRRELAGARLDTRYELSRCEAEARIHDALFFQVGSDGWKARKNRPTGSALPGTTTDDRMVAVTVNLPNGTTVFRKALFMNKKVPSKFAEEFLWETITELCDGMVEKCAGIVADRFKSKALRDLENQNHWMVNLACQLQGFHSLIKDFAGELPLFRVVAVNCSKLSHFFNTKLEVRSLFRKYLLRDTGQSSLLRTINLSSNSHSSRGVGYTENDFSPVFAMIEDIMLSYRYLHSTVVDPSYKRMSVEDPTAAEVSDMIQDMSFWGNLEAVHSLVNLVSSMAQEMEVERPLVGRCLPLWDELRSKVKEWCNKFNIDDTPVNKIMEKRFRKNYHPAWSAAFILDPFYLMRDPSGKYLPPFKCLTTEQEKDVERLITRLVSPEEAHIALMELMKWRSEGLDSLYAQAVQIKQRDPMTGKMKIANPQSSRLVWETYLSEFKSLRKVAVRLIFLQATANGFKCNLSFIRWLGSHQRRSNSVMDRAQKMVFIGANAKLDRRDFSSEEDKDWNLFFPDHNNNGDDHLLHDGFTDATSL